MGREIGRWAERSVPTTTTSSACWRAHSVFLRPLIRFFLNLILLKYPQFSDAHNAPQ